MEYIYSPIYKYIAYAICFYMFLKLQFKTLSNDALIQILLGSVVLIISADYLFIENQPSLVPKFLKEQFFDDDEDEESIDVENFNLDSIIDESAKKHNDGHGHTHYYPEQIGSPVHNNISDLGGMTCDSMSCGSRGGPSVGPMDGMPMRFNEPPQHAMTNNLLMNPNSYMMPNY